MVTSGPVDREQFHKELIAEFNEIVAKFDTYKTVTEDKAKGLIAKQFPRDGGHIGICCKYVSKRLTMDHFTEYHDNHEKYMPALYQVPVERLPDTQGFETFFFKMPAPMMDDRAYISVFFREKLGDKCMIYGESTRNTEALREQFAAKFNKTVVMDVPLALQKVEVLADGLHLTTVSGFRLNGMVPTFIENMAVKEEANVPLAFEEYMVDGTI